MCVAIGNELLNKLLAIYLIMGIEKLRFLLKLVSTTTTTTAGGGECKG